MQEKLPAVHKKKIWIVVGVITALAFFLLWTMSNQGTPAKLDAQGLQAPPPPSP